MSNLEATIQTVADLLFEAESILFITGAGVSADSGLPTYRGVEGLYDSKSTDEGVAIEVALSAQMLASRPELTWKYLWQIGEASFGAKPNAAHKAIAEFEKCKRDVWVITQNIDGLHRAAGSQNLVESHGYMFELCCTECGMEYSTREILSDFSTTVQLPPLCEKCAGVIRPGVVLFNEMLPMKVMNSLERIANTRFDIVVVVGTSAVFPYIVAPISRAKRENIPTVEINPSRTEISQKFDYRIELGAVEAMERILACLAE